MRIGAVAMAGLASAALVGAAPDAGTAERPNTRRYAVPFDQVWIAATRVAYGMPQWIVVGASEESGVVTVRKAPGGMSLPKPRIRVTVERTGPSETRVMLQHAAGGPLDFLSWWADGGEVPQFFKTLDDRLPATNAPTSGAS